MIFATMVFDVISIIYIVIALLALFIGLKRGFLATLISLLKNVLALIVATLFCKPLANLLSGTSLGTTLSSKLVDTFSAKGGVFTTTITVDNKEEVITNCLRQLKVPSILDKTIMNLTNSFIDSSTQTVSEVLSHAITFYALIFISFLLILIVARLLVVLLNKLFVGIKSLPLVGFVNSILGGVLYLAMGAILICLISYGLTFLISMGNTTSNWLIEQMTLNDDAKTCISEYIYNKNFFLKIISYISELLHTSK